MATYICSVCGFVYDEEKGIPEDGIKAGTKWSDVPEDFVCPLCGVGKDQFNKVEEKKEVKKGEKIADKAVLENKDNKNEEKNIKKENKKEVKSEKPEKKYAIYICNACEYVYDEELGIPEDDIKAGTIWEKLPEDWVCPLCGVGKEDFERKEK